MHWDKALGCAQAVHVAAHVRLQKDRGDAFAMTCCNDASSLQAEKAALQDELSSKVAEADVLHSDLDQSVAKADSLTLRLSSTQAELDSAAEQTAMQAAELQTLQARSAAQEAASAAELDNARGQASQLGRQLSERIQRLNVLQVW